MGIYILIIFFILSIHSYSYLGSYYKLSNCSIIPQTRYSCIFLFLYESILPNNLQNYFLVLYVWHNLSHPYDRLMSYRYLGVVVKRYLDNIFIKKWYNKKIVSLTDFAIRQPLSQSIPIWFEVDSGKRIYNYWR